MGFIFPNKRGGLGIDKTWGTGSKKGDGPESQLETNRTKSSIKRVTEVTADGIYPLVRGSPNTPRGAKHRSDNLRPSEWQGGHPGQGGLRDPRRHLQGRPGPPSGGLNFPVHNERVGPGEEEGEEGRRESEKEEEGQGPWRRRNSHLCRQDVKWEFTLLSVERLHILPQTTLEAT